MGDEPAVSALPRRAAARRWDHRASRPPSREAALEALFVRSYTPMCRLAALVVGDRDLAEQLVMDAFAATLAHWDDLRDPASSDAYLRRAVVNAARSAVRRRAVEWSANAAALAREGTATDRPVSGAAEEAPVLDAVRALPDRQRAAVVLHYYEDLADADIADLLGCATGTVKSQLSKARTSLARTLRAQGYEL